MNSAHETVFMRCFLYLGQVLALVRQIFDLFPLACSQQVSGFGEPQIVILLVESRRRGVGVSGRIKMAGIHRRNVRT